MKYQIVFHVNGQKTEGQVEADYATINSLGIVQFHQANSSAKAVTVASAFKDWSFFAVMPERAPPSVKPEQIEDAGSCANCPPVEANPA